jgi:hypothetical protein
MSRSRRRWPRRLSWHGLARHRLALRLWSAELADSLMRQAVLRQAVLRHTVLLHTVLRQAHLALALACGPQTAMLGLSRSSLVHAAAAHTAVLLHARLRWRAAAKAGLLSVGVLATAVMTARLGATA